MAFKPTKPQHITNKAYVDANSGAGSGKFIVNVSTPNLAFPTLEVMDKTWKEIHDAMANGVIPVVIYNEDVYSITSVGHDASSYYVNVNWLGNTTAFGTDSETSYPNCDFSD